jgi:hypothetical protein
MPKQCVSCEQEDCCECQWLEQEIENRNELGDDPLMDEEMGLHDREDDEGDDDRDDPETDYPHDDDGDDEDDENEYDDSMDGDAESALTSAGMGNDESYGPAADEV